MHSTVYAKLDFQRPEGFGTWPSLLSLRATIFALLMSVYLPIWAHKFKLMTVGSIPLANSFAQHPGRYKAQDALTMPRGRRELRNERPRPPRRTVHIVPPRLPAECCRGDRLALSAH
jgi:hypothetical protein